jgi:hypothetical protein
MHAPHASGMRSLALLACLVGSLGPACVADEPDLSTAQLEATAAPSAEDMEAIQAAEDAAGDEAVLAPGCNCTSASYDYDCDDYAYIGAGFACEPRGLDETVDNYISIEQTRIRVLPGSDMRIHCPIPIVNDLTAGYGPDDIGSVYIYSQFNVTGKQISCTLYSGTPDIESGTSRGTCTATAGTGVRQCAITAVDTSRIPPDQDSIIASCLVPAPSSGQTSALLSVRVCYDVDP